MKLLLISISLEKATMAFPLGLSALKTVLDRTTDLPAGFETEILPLYLSDYTASGSAPEAGEDLTRAEEIILETILEARPDMVGFSVYIWNREVIVGLSRKLESQHPSIIQIAGGAEATANPRALMRDSSLDTIVLGDGEMILPGLIKGLDSPGQAPGVFERNGPLPKPAYNTHPGTTPSSFLAETLDITAFPGLLWETARGCPYGCSFCYESRGRDRVAAYPYDRMEEELQFFSRRGVCKVFVLDPSFNVNKKHALRILKLISENAPEIHFTFEIKGEELDEELAAAFSGVNCYLQLGLQSAEEEPLRKVNRVFNRDKFTEGCRLLNEYDVPFGLDLIYGLPGDRFEGFLRSLDYALDLHPENLDIFPLAVLPGTGLAMEAGDFNLEYNHSAPYLIRSTPEFPAEDLKRAEELTKAADLFLSGPGVRNWLPPLLKASELSPSGFLTAFKEWLKDHDSSGPFREAFAEAVLAASGSKNGIPAALSLIRLYDGLAEAAETGEPCERHLYFSPEELELAGIEDLRTYPDRFKRKEQLWFIWFEEGELCLEPSAGEDSW